MSEVRERQHAEAIGAIQHALLEIESQRREPDMWERVNLLSALDLVLRGAYPYVGPIVRHAMTPSDEHVDIGHDPAFDVCDIEFFRRALAQVAAEPIRDHATVAPWRDG